jgi:hypothetical protein
VFDSNYKIDVVAKEIKSESYFLAFDLGTISMSRLPSVRIVFNRLGNGEFEDGHIHSFDVSVSPTPRLLPWLAGSYMHSLLPYFLLPSLEEALLL